MKFLREYTISTHAPAGGATPDQGYYGLSGVFLLTPLREGRPRFAGLFVRAIDFYSRPCGRGDNCGQRKGERTWHYFYSRPCGRGDSVALKKDGVTVQFLLTPLREGRPHRQSCPDQKRDFYSRPCGRGDTGLHRPPQAGAFLLTPLREGRHGPRRWKKCRGGISTHAPAGGATREFTGLRETKYGFLLTPLREGRLGTDVLFRRGMQNFYSRPCGRGDGRRRTQGKPEKAISTHAPAGGATSPPARSEPR